MKVQIVEQEEMVIVRQWLGEHVSAATHQHATVNEMLEAAFSLWSALRLHSEDQREKIISWMSKLAVSSLSYKWVVEFRNWP